MPTRKWGFDANFVSFAKLPPLTPLLSPPTNPPVITFQPQSQTVAYGSNATFNVSATGSGTLSYQWSFNGTNISKATNSLLTLTNVQFSQAGNYAVLVTNAFGSILSSNAVLTVVALPPTILVQPTNQTVFVNGTATFGVTATGSLPLSYQWNFNGTNLNWATNSSLTLTNVQLNQAGNYAVQVVNAFGSTNSTDAVLTVVALPPTIQTQPTDQTVFVNDTATFTVVAGGTAPLSYQWNFNGTNISGATNTSLTLTNVQFSQAGNYAVLVTNLFGSVLSSNAALTVNPPPPCDPAPSRLVGWWQGEGNANDIVGNNKGTLVGGASFAASKVGQAFSFNNSGTQAVDIPRSSNLNITNQVTIEFWMKADPGNSMHSFQGFVTSDYYFISITVGNPNLGKYGVDFGINDNGTYYEIANANGGGATVSAGVWHHIAGTYDGTKCQLYVDGQPWGNPMLHTGSISPMPTNGFVSIGSEDGRVSCGCTGRHFWGLIDEASIYNRALSSNEIAAIYSADGSGKCPLPPAILAQPTDQMVTVGGTVIFSVTASGTPPLSYQWSFDGTNIVGATNMTLTLTNVQFNQVGNYAVLVTNAFGSVASSNVVLTVLLPPSITTQPAGCTNVAGTTANFNIVADGTEPLSYQWQFNNTNLDGATNATLTLNNVTMDQAGAYSVTITNIAGSIISSNAVLSVYATAAAMLNGCSFSCVDGIQFQVAGVPGFNYAVQESTNLIDWVSLFTNTSPFSFTDTNTVNLSQQFYRAIYMP